MWQASTEQQARIKALVAAFTAEVPTLWDLSQQSWWDPDVKQPDPCRGLVERLDGRFGGATLAEAMPEFLAFPDANDLPKHWPEGDEPGRRTAQVALFVATEWVAAHGDGYAIGLIAERLRHLLAHLEDDPEVCDKGLADRRSYGQFYTHHIEGCTRLLARLRDRPAALDQIEDLLLGRWDGPISLPDTVAHWPLQTTRYEFGRQWLARALAEEPRYDPQEEDDGRERSCLERLYNAGRLDYDGFVQFFRHLPDLVPTHLFGCGPEEVAEQTAFERVLFEFNERLVWDAAQAWNEATIAVLKEFRREPRGARWLVKACEHTQALGLSAIAEKDYSDTSMRVLRGLAGIDSLTPDETPEAVAEQLRRFDQKTLLAVLPLANAGEDAVLRALDWEDTRPFFDWLRETARHPPEQRGFEAANDVSNSDNPDSGVVDRRRLLDMLEAVGPTRVKKLVAAFRGAKLPVGNILTLLEAAAGWNRKKVETAVAKHGQIAIKAYGLLPLERGGQEVVERYMLFKQVAKECAKYGPERQANTRAAAQAGIANLAQTAGYPDPVRLEWDMEARVADEGVPLDRREAIDDWEIELTLDGLDAKLQVLKQGKPLTTVPAGLRKLERFLAFKATQARLKAQVSRFRATLEGMMTEGDTLGPEDLRSLAGLPVVSRLLQGLILRTETGHYGLFDPQGPGLSGLGGARMVINGEVRIAHSQDLFGDGLLPDWQREVVQRRLVQPFKQAFRELYVLTPAEEDTHTFSNRFAGHLLKANVASRLLQARGWTLSSGDFAEVSKPFRKAGLVAGFDFPDAGHYLAETDAVTSDQIRFLGHTHQPVPLKEVPPLIFSEVMRDADLIVSVAQAEEGQGIWSPESFQRRAELVTALVGDLGLKGVRCEGHFAHIIGKRASYRVHLGSAVIHIDPGNYLCIVPDRTVSATADVLFLPFADAEPKASEVISKILFLANDDQIRDKGILVQIAASKPG
ncbi:DUF4132 domain-containing protein [uncultured Thiodictyon sp.]|uniref:DUF4132 domain-containing protein n=1 Tax=uncultured Thiodictyon sp. TaxID=1846217 RepID=UPI0025FF2004|nr:DUF4132 domain-containing protein [uncultured Thiodictyon sp.]